MDWLVRLSCLLLAASSVPPAEAGGLASPGCMAGGEAAVVTGVDARLDLGLADGRTVHLPGIAVPEATEQARADLAAWLTGASVTVAPLHPEPDRWGRTVALVFAAPTTAPERPVSVSEALIDAGRVLARADPALESCWASNLALEHEAERQQRGLWATSPVLAPGDGEGLRARAGALAVVAGRIGAVRDGRARLYLRFVNDGRTGFAAALAPSLVRRLGKAGSDPHAWTGRRLRVRGTIDDRWGWQIEVTEAQQLELDPP